MLCSNILRTFSLYFLLYLSLLLYSRGSLDELVTLFHLSSRRKQLKSFTFIMQRAIAQVSVPHTHAHTHMHTHAHINRYPLPHPQPVEVAA